MLGATEMLSKLTLLPATAPAISAPVVAAPSFAFTLLATDSGFAPMALSTGPNEAEKVAAAKSNGKMQPLMMQPCASADDSAESICATLAAVAQGIVERSAAASGTTQAAPLLCIVSDETAICSKSEKVLSVSAQAASEASEAILRGAAKLPPQTALPVSEAGDMNSKIVQNAADPCIQDATKPSSELAPASCLHASTALSVAPCDEDSQQLSEAVTTATERKASDRNQKACESTHAKPGRREKSGAKSTDSPQQNGEQVTSGLASAPMPVASAPQNISAAPVTRNTAGKLSAAERMPFDTTSRPASSDAVVPTLLTTPAQVEAPAVAAVPGEKIPAKDIEPQAKAAWQADQKAVADPDSQRLATLSLRPPAMPRGMLGHPDASALPASASAASAMNHDMTLQTYEAATPNKLEVGISGGTWGWLKVRAELTQTGDVHAFVRGASTTAEHALKAQSSDMVTYLGTQQINLKELHVETARISTLSIAGDTFGDASREGGSGAEARESRAVRTKASESHGSSEPVPWMPPQAFNGAGGWLNVLA